MIQLFGYPEACAALRWNPSSDLIHSVSLYLMENNNLFVIKLIVVHLELNLIIHPAIGGCSHCATYDPNSLGLRHIWTEVDCWHKNHRVVM